LIDDGEPSAENHFMFVGLSEALLAIAGGSRV
jgi:hypothetical protein